MKRRELYLDVLKVVALVFMVFIHAFEIVANSEIINESINMDALTNFVAIIYLFAPTVFMYSMGASIAITKKNEPIKFYKRGIKLLLTGLVLNLIRGSVFLVFGEEYYFEFLLWIVGSDILFFAGLYFLIFGLFRQFKLKDNLILIITILMNIISGLLIPIIIDDVFISQLLGNFIYCDYDSVFPLLSWAIYPTIGYYLTNKLLISDNKKILLKRILSCSLFILIITIGILLLTNHFEARYFLWGEMDYFMDIITSIITVCILLIYVIIIYYLSSLIKNQKIKDFFSSIASKLTTIYFIHWIILMGCFLFFCLNTYVINSVLFIFAFAFVVLVISTLLAYCYKK